MRSSTANAAAARTAATARGSTPRTRRGLTDATVDEDTINRWWTEFPTANVGVATGPESGCFMIGPDGQEGIDALAVLEKQNGPLPTTLRLRSGGGGRHYYFAWPAEGGIKTGANSHGLPIDVRGAGGLAVAPPSLHASGNRYVWEVLPDTAPLASAPEWLLEWQRKGKGTGKRKKSAERTKETNQSPASTNGKILFTVGADRSSDVQARAVAYLERCDPAVSGLNGHNQTFEVARAIVYGFALGPEVGFDLLDQHYNPRCQPPWSETELRHKCSEADTKLFDKPRGYLLNEEIPAPASATPCVTGAATEDIEALPMPQQPPWPTLPPEALQGLPGEIVRTIEPQTESDPVGILGQLLVAFGNAIGRKPYYPVEGDRHYPNLFLNTVGKSAHGRKGTAWGRVRQTMNQADADWLGNCVRSGLASGEGLIYFVRDPVMKRNEDGEIEVVDEGVEDKRLLVVEGEFAQVLRVLKREGNTLSVFVRQAWDTGTLASLTKNSPLKATDAHVSIIGHITTQELGKYLDQTEMFNGFANRFLWLMVKRSKLLPDGGRDLDLSALGLRLDFALAAARNVGPMTRDQVAGRLWREMYPQLTAERSGLYGAVTGRAEAQVLRLSMIYALLDCKGIIEEIHLQAALALWSYADASARMIFGAEAEDPLVTLVRAKLKEAGSTGMTRTELHNAFSRNIAAAKLLEALATLRDRNEAYSDRPKTGRAGAPAERWFAGRKPEEIDSLNSSVRRPASENTEAEEVPTL
jgi:hypothetical protein